MQPVVKAPKSSHSHPSVSALAKNNWVIEYKLLSLTYKVLTTTQPSYLYNVIRVQPPRSTRSSSLVTLARPSIHRLIYVQQTIPSSILPVVSGINCWLLSVNRALISPFLTRLPSVPPTHHSRHLSPLTLSFQAESNPFLQILPTVAFPFFFTADSTDSPDRLPILLTFPPSANVTRGISVFYFFSFFLFSTFLVWFRVVH